MRMCAQINSHFYKNVDFFIGQQYNGWCYEACIFIFSFFIIPVWGAFLIVHNITHI